jgi:hypothetical protein
MTMARLARAVAILTPFDAWNARSTATYCSDARTNVDGLRAP